MTVTLTIACWPVSDPLVNGYLQWHHTQNLNTQSKQWRFLNTKHQGSCSWCTAYWATRTMCSHHFLLGHTLTIGHVWSAGAQTLRKDRWCPGLRTAPSLAWEKRKTEAGEQVPSLLFSTSIKIRGWGWLIYPADSKALLWNPIIRAYCQL